MSPETDYSALCERVREASDRKLALNICAGNSKSFYGNTPQGEVLDVSTNSGILHYEPSELVITARAGTKLSELEHTLGQYNQMLAFEPPHFGENATLGGTIACGLSGPRRPFAGAARDFVLGCKIINGRAGVATFGGEVMKNVAGYDVARLMTGAMGTLGILLEVSLKVLPRPVTEITLAYEMNARQAQDAMTRWQRKTGPLSGACHFDNTLYMRLSGTEQAVSACHTAMGGDLVKNGARLWHELNEHELRFFKDDRPLWRVSVAPHSRTFDVSGDTLLDWGGAQRWILQDSDDIRKQAEHHGGHATLFRGRSNNENTFHPLPENMMQLQRRIKQAFDPAGVFNPGRLYSFI